MPHPVCPQSVQVSKGLEYRISFEKEVQLYPARCLHEAHRKQTRCYKYLDGGIHTRTKVSWNLLNLNQVTFFFLRNKQTTIVMGHNQEKGTQNLKPVMLCLQCLFLWLVWLKSCAVSRTQCASPMV